MLMVNLPSLIKCPTASIQSGKKIQIVFYPELFFNMTSIKTEHKEICSYSCKSYFLGGGVGYLLGTYHKQTKKFLKK